MRTKRIKLYSYTELSTQAKDKAIADWLNGREFMNNDKYLTTEFFEEQFMSWGYEFLQDGTLFKN